MKFQKFIILVILTVITSLILGGCSLSGFLNIFSPPSPTPTPTPTFTPTPTPTPSPTPTPTPTPSPSPTPTATPYSGCPYSH